ncbi:MAG TPA: hypothetical protein VHG91_11090 [Longimicrobium sp.]|nr:hypothetical protein [Longimicrobium sp.]
MAAERDQGSEAGPGLTGTGGYRDAEGLNAGTTGGASMGDRGLGGAEVHGGLHSSGRTGDDYSGIAFAGQEQQGGLKNRVRDAAGTVAERAGELGGRAREALGNVAGGRVGDVASTARERVGGTLNRAQGVLEERGVLSRVRDNALPALGLAFGVGFLLALSDNKRVQPGSKMYRAKSELRGAVMAGLSAGAAQAVRGFMGQAGSEDGFLNTLLRGVVGGGSQQGGGGYGGQGGAGGSRDPYASRGGYGSQGTGGTAGRSSGGYGGGRTTGTPHREPSHRENL